MNWRELITIPIFLLIISLIFAEACNEYDERHPRDIHAPTIFVTDSTQDLRNCDECIKRNVDKGVPHKEAVVVCRRLWLNDTTTNVPELREDEWIEPSIEY